MSLFGFRNFTFGLLSVLFAVAPVSAALQNDSVHSLREVVVSESRTAKTLRSTSPLQQLDNESLQGLSALQVSDAVKHFSGVVVKDYGGIGGLKTVSVRSLGASHTAVSYDGIALSDMQTGQIDIGRFSLDNVEMLSLSSGQSDQIFQPARLFASAAVLDIRTPEPAFAENQKLNGNVALKAGSFGLLNPALQLNLKINSIFSARFSSEWLSSHGEYPYKLYYSQNKNDSSSLEKRENSDVKNLRLEGMLFARPSANSKASVKAYFYDSERGLPGATIYYNTANFSSQRIWDRNFFTQAHYEYNPAGKLAVQSSAKFNRTGMRYNDPTTLNIAGETDNNYLQNEYYHSVSALWRATSGLSFNYSADYAWNNLHSDMPQFAYPVRHTFLNVLAGKYVNDYLLITGSLLHTGVLENTRLGEQAPNQSKWSPYISFSLMPMPSQDLRIRFFYKNIFRIPTFNDLYYSRIGNPKLKPEDAHQLNAGITYGFSAGELLEHLSLTADIYHNKVKNKIVAYPTKNIFEWTMLNYGLVHINGIDLSGDALFSLSGKTELLLGASHSYQRALSKTDVNNRDYNHQIPYTPRVSGSGRAGIHLPWLQINYALVWSGHRYTESQNFTENRVAGYVDHNISVSKNWNLYQTRLLTQLELTNLSDKNYEVVRSFPMPGRAMRVTARLSF